MKTTHAAALVCWLGWVSIAVGQAVPPNALESAYWRFEEGTAGTIVPFGPNTVPDSINQNHMRRWIEDFAAPTYTTTVPVAVIPQTGQPNTLALDFTPNRDLYAEGKNINNPIAEAFTIELAFRPDLVTFPNGPYQAVFGKDGKPIQTGPLQTLVIKIRGDNGLLQWEWFDRDGNVHSLVSLAPMEVGRWYYVAAVATSMDASLYLDSNDGNGYVLQGSTSLTGGPIWQGTDPAIGDDWAWTIGRGMFNGGVTDWFDGIIDEVRLTNRALDPVEFLFHEFVPPIPADFNGDSKVDEADIILFNECATGPEIPYGPGNLPPACQLGIGQNGFLQPDLDQDRDVDQTDFAILQVGFTG